MENEFTQVMSKRTDEDLIKILSLDREKYNPDALEAAETEFKKRDIDAQKLEQVKEKATSEETKVKSVNTYAVGSSTRFLNFIIDFFCWNLLSLLLLFIFGLFLPIDIENVGLLNLFIILIYVVTFISYHAVMETKFQKTVGKFVTKTKVVEVNGEVPNSSKILERSLYRLIPFDRLSFLFTRNGIHDYLSKTKVVKDTFNIT